MTTHIRSWLSSFSTKTTRRKQKFPAARCRLQAELLEARWTPAASGPVTFALIGDYGVASSILNLGNDLLGAPDGEGNVAQLVHSWNPALITTVGDNNYLAGEQFDTNITLDLQLAMALGTSPSTVQSYLDDLDKLPVPGLAFTANGATTANSATVTGIKLPAFELAVGMAVYDAVSSEQNIPFPTGPSSPFFTSITSISGADNDLTITLSAPAAKTLSKASIAFLPANVSLQGIDGLSHIDRNVGRYYSDYIYPYVTSVSSGQFGNGSPTGTNRFFPTPGNHDWADPYSDGGASAADKELALPSQAVEKFGMLMGSSFFGKPTIKLSDKSELTIGMSVLSNGLPTIDPNDGPDQFKFSIFDLARIESIATNAPTASFTGDTTTGQPTIANVSSFAGLFEGMEVSGPGIPAGATITDLNSNNPSNLILTLTANATGTAFQAALSAADYTVTLTTVLGGVNDGVANALFAFLPIFTGPSGSTIAGGTLQPYLNYFAGLNPTDSPGFKMGTTVVNGQTVPLTQPYYYSFTAGTTASGQPLIEFFAFDSDPADPNLVNTAKDPTMPTAAEVATSNQGVWLKNAMASSKALWKIPYFHHSPYTSSFEPDEGPNGEWMRLPFQQWGATAVIYGHVHNYERLSEKDPAIPGVSPAGTVEIPYFLNGLGGASVSGFLGEVDPGSKLRYNGAFGAMKIVADEQSLNLKFINIYGAVIDDFTISAPPSPAQTSTPGVWDPLTATWYLRNSNSSGSPDAGQFSYGFAPAKAVTGDWNGDGVTTIGVYDQTTFLWYLRDSNSAGAPTVTPFAYGFPRAIPVVGDWDGDGATTIGVYDPNTASWYLRDTNSAGAPNIMPFSFGFAGVIPVVGDWDGDGKTTIGVYDPRTATWYLRNSNDPGAPSFIPFAYGMGSNPVVGDWNQDGKTTIGVFTASDATWFLRDSNDSGAPTVTPFAYGLGIWTPVTGSWDALLQAASGASVNNPSAESLTQSQLDGIVTAAQIRLADAGLDDSTFARLSNIRFSVDELADAELGSARTNSNSIVIDASAAGYGWFVDQTPLDDDEFVNGVARFGSQAARGMDLLTAVLHELGHFAGLADRADVGGADVMNGALSIGERHVALDAFFADPLQPAWLGAGPSIVMDSIEKTGFH